MSEPVLNLKVRTSVTTKGRLLAFIKFDEWTRVGLDNFSGGWWTHDAVIKTGRSIEVTFNYIQPHLVKATLLKKKTGRVKAQVLRGRYKFEFNLSDIHLNPRKAVDSFGSVEFVDATPPDVVVPRMKIIYQNVDITQKRTHRKPKPQQEQGLF